MAPEAKNKNIARLIRNILDGRNVAAARRWLIAIGEPAVGPVLDALTGGHGRRHPDAPNASDDLLKVLAGIAEKDADAVAGSLTHDAPAFNASVWALGHSRSRHVRQILKGLLDHEDNGVRGVADFHLFRNRKKKVKKPTRKKVATRRAAPRKKAPKRVARRKKAAPR